MSSNYSYTEQDLLWWPAETAVNYYYNDHYNDFTGCPVASLKYDTFHSKKKNEGTTLLLGTLLTIAAEVFAPYNKVYVSHRTMKCDICVWFFMWLCKLADLNNLPQYFQGPKSCGFRLKMPY